MKASFRIWAALAAVMALAASAKAAVLISDFSNLDAQLLPPMNFSWSVSGTDQYIQSAGFGSIAPVSGGNPTGEGSFNATLLGGGSLDFSNISFVSLNARVDDGNTSSIVKVVFLDNAGLSVAFATFQASSFTSSFSTQEVSLNLTIPEEGQLAGDLSQVTYWRVEGDGISSDSFRYSFDNLNVSATPVPEPSSGLLGLAGAGCVGLLAGWKRRQA